MDGLSFGEQVKIILSRKNMTIKELAELIEEKTGKAMSRQNLTQRLGRDNFQEQDMRMIATILGCPFRLSIFPEDAQEDAHMMQYANLVGGPKRSRKQKAENETEEMYQQTLVFDEKLEPVIEPEPIGMQPKADLSDKDLMTKEDEMPAEEPEELPEEDERDMTIGELYDIHEELSELEEQKPKAETEKRGTDRFRTGGLFFRRKGKHGEDREREEAERLERIAKEQAEKKEEEERLAKQRAEEERRDEERVGEEAKRERTEQSFLVPKAEIVANGYDLSINKYKKTVYVEETYPHPLEIMTEIRQLESEITSGLAELEAMLRG